MKTVWKYQISPIGETVIELPIPHRFLCVELQFGVPHVWVEHEVPNDAKRKYVFQLIPTGSEVPKHAFWCGTLFSPNAEFVFHVYRHAVAHVADATRL